MLWHWLAGLTLIIAGSIAVFWGLLARRLAHDPRRRCPKCAYDLSATPGLQCPECGRTAKSEPHLFRKRRQWWMGMLGCLSVFAGIATMARPLPADTLLGMVPKSLLLQAWKYAWTDAITGRSSGDRLAYRWIWRVQSPSSDKAEKERIGRAALYRLQEKQVTSPEMAWYVVAYGGLPVQEIEPLALDYLKNRPGAEEGVCLALYMSGFQNPETATELVKVIQSTTDAKAHAYAIAAIARMGGLKFASQRDAWIDAIPIVDPTMMGWVALSMSESDAMQVSHRLLHSTDPLHVRGGVRFLAERPGLPAVTLNALVNVAVHKSHLAHDEARALAIKMDGAMNKSLLLSMTLMDTPKRLEAIQILRERGHKAKSALLGLRQLAKNDAVAVEVRRAAEHAIAAIEIDIKAEASNPKANR